MFISFMRLDNKNFSLLIIMALLFITSCEEEKGEVFVQPKVLSENAQFDFATLTFNENVSLLISKSLDTVNYNYSPGNYEDYLFPKESDLDMIFSSKDLTCLTEKRYYFKMLEMDSISQFDGVYFNEVYIETNKDLQMQSCVGYAYFYSTTVLDSMLLRMYHKYGKTSFMREVERDAGMVEVLTVSDSAGIAIKNISYEKPDIDYESYLYEYVIGGGHSYYEWKLKDRVLQLEITKGRAMEVDLVSGKMEDTVYYRVEYLIVRIEEYNRIEERIIDASKKNKFPVDIAKPYNIDALNFYNHYDKFTNRFPDL